MKDIKILYETAKSSGKTSDINSYKEAVKELIEIKPTEFIPNLEYIITSDINVSRLDDFVEKYGLSISAYHPIVECLQSCIEKCESKKIDSSLYKEYLEKFESFRKKYKNCFDMYEYYENELPENYTSTYYSFNENGFQNNKLLVGMIKEFGEASIADAIITADRLGGKALQQVSDYIEKMTESTTDISGGSSRNNTLSLWISEAFKDVDINQTSFVESKVHDMINSNNKSYMESIMMGDTNRMLEYSEDDLDALRDLISFKEYQITLCENTDDAIKLQKDIYSLYEELDGVMDENYDYIYNESSSNKGLIKEIKKKILDLCKNIQKKSKKDFKDRIKEHNKKYGIFDNNRILYTRLWATIGDNMDPFFWGKLGIGGKIDKYILQDNSRSKWMDRFRIYLVLEVSTLTPLSASKKKKYINFYYNVISSSLSDLIGEDKISLDKKEANEIKLSDKDRKFLNDNKVFNEYTYMTYITTWCIPIFLNREYIMGDMDELNLSESTIIEIGKSVFNELMSDNYFDEKSYIVNTRNKKTGDAPLYLSNNHDIGWGENDAPKKKPDEKSLEDYERPSAKRDKINNELNDHYDDTSDELGVNNSNESKPKYDPDKNSVNNYYYYTYNNSMNRNSNSFNKDNSNHTDNSTNNKTDDHSTGKRINSNDYRGESTNQSNTVIGKYLPITDDQRGNILSEFLRMATIVKNICNECVGMYQDIYGIESNLDDFSNELLHDILSINKRREDGSVIVIPGIDSEYLTANIDISLFHGFNTDEFMKNLEEKYPDEIERLKNKYDISKRYDRFTIHNEERINGNSKNLINICNEIVTNIMEKCGNIISKINFDGDNDTGPSYSGKMKITSILDKSVDINNLQDYIQRFRPNNYNTESESVYNNYSMPWELNILPENNVYNEGAITAGLFILPLIIGGFSLLYISIENHKYKSKVNKAISDILGIKVKDSSKYTAKARSIFGEFLNKNNSTIDKECYREIKEVNAHSKPEFSFYVNGKKTDGPLKVIMMVGNYLMNEKSMKQLSSKLSDNNVEVNFIDYTDLPGDDNGGSWEMFIKAGIVEGGPDDYDEENGHDNKWMDEQYDKITKSGYKDVKLILVIDGEKYLKENYMNGVIDESCHGLILEDASERDRPQSDHPIKDMAQDIDRNLAKKHQEMKRKVQQVQNVGKSIMKPINRTKGWIDKVVHDWKDANENDIKDRIADPNARRNLFTAINKAIKVGSLAKAGLLFNPFILFLTITNGISKNKRLFVIRNNVIHELRGEIKVLEAKIQDADRSGDHAAKYKLMRLKNELEKKLIRVGGDNKGKWSKII